MRVAFIIPTGAALLAALASPGAAQELRRAGREVKPVEQHSIPGATFTWREMLELDRALRNESLPLRPMEVSPAMIEQPVQLDLGADGKKVAQAGDPQSAGPEQMTTCAGFGGEPDLEQDFEAQPDVLDGLGFTYFFPDAAGGVGPEHLMTMMNNKVTIRDRAGASVSSVDPAAFWAPATDGTLEIANPRITYDATSGRWIATAFDGPRASARTVMAMSSTDDPTGAWTFWGIDADATNVTFNDWVATGYNGTWIAICANMFNVSTLAAAGAKLWAVDKSTALAGGALTVTEFPSNYVGTATGGFAVTSMFPATTFDAAEPTLYMVSNGGFNSGGIPLLTALQITGTGAAPVVAGVPGSGFGGAASGLFAVNNSFSFTQRVLQQLSEARNHSPFSVRMASVIVRNGRIWCAHSGGFPGPIGNAAVTRTVVAWYQVNPAAMPTPIVQSGLIDAGNLTAAIVPSIAVNCGDDAVVGFTVGDSTRFIESAYVVRAGTDPVNTMSPIRLLKAGESNFYKNTAAATGVWGRYSSAAVDPKNDLALWVLQKYAETRVGGADIDSRWGTWWGRLGECGEPTVDDEPDSISVCAGQQADFTVVASSLNPPISYQWRKDTFDISGANAATYTIPSTVIADGGSYDVVLTDACGTSISLAATLSFNGATFNQQPIDQTAAIGSPATFTVNVTGTGTINYQWLADGNPIPLENGSSYTIPSVAIADYFTEYSVEVTDDCGPVTSDTARVHPPRQNGKHQLAELSLHVFLHPESLIGCEDGQVTFEATAYPASATYLWRKDGVVIVPNETNSSLTLTNLSAADEGDYDVVVSDGNRTKQSNDATLTVTTVGTITSQPADKTGSVGGSAVFSTSATGTNLTYQWKHRSNVPFSPFVDIPGAIEPTLTIDPIQASDAGSYRCHITNQCGQVTTRIARLTIL